MLIRKRYLQIQINHRATYLAACDDAGDVRVLDLKSHKWMRPLERKHENVSQAEDHQCLHDEETFFSSLNYVLTQMLHIH
jgi:hypothetical protein